MPGSAFSRYRNLPIVEVDGQLAVTQRPERLPVPAIGAAEHVVVGEETLDLLALRYYAREELWWRIADANPTRVLFDLAPGDRLVIPPLRVATNTGRKA
jgi:nucleoid-associated protein YgaU